jgi:hypothetical protein
MLREFFSDSVYVSNESAARIIRGFVNGTQRNDGDWDDLESVNHSNPEVSLAIDLCKNYAESYPPTRDSEYCGANASPYFLAIADVLEEGLLAPMIERDSKNCRHPHTTSQVHSVAIEELLVNRTQEYLKPVEGREQS